MIPNCLEPCSVACIRDLLRLVECSDVGLEEVSEPIYGDETESRIRWDIELAIVSERVGSLRNGSDRCVESSSHFDLMESMLAPIAKIFDISKPF